MPTEREFRETIDFHPVLLYKQDLIELEALLLDSYTHANDSLDLTLTYNDENFRASTASELLEIDGLPKSTDKLSIDRIGWIDKDKKATINRGIRITFYTNYIHCQIHSLDEDWYKGKVTRLRTFLKKRKPWYTFIKKITPILPTFALASLFYSVYLFAVRGWVSALLPFSLFAILLITAILSLNQKLFPYVKIILRDKTKRTFGSNEIIIVLNIILILLMIFQIFHNNSPNK